MHIHPEVLKVIHELIKSTDKNEEIGSLRIYIKFDNDPNNDLSINFIKNSMKLLFI